MIFRFAFSRDYEIMVKLLELGTLIIKQNSSAFNVRKQLVELIFQFNSSAPSNVPPKVKKMLQSGDLTDFFANILPITLFEINGWSSSQEQRRGMVLACLTLTCS